MNKYIISWFIVWLCNMTYAQNAGLDLKLEESSAFFPNGRVSLLRKKDFSDHSLENDFIRLAAKNYSNAEYDLYCDKCRLVNSVSELYVRCPDLSRKEFKIFRKEFLIPHNYNCSFRKYRKEKPWSFQRSCEYKNYLAKNNPKLLDSLFIIKYNSDTQIFRKQMKEKDVGDFIKILGFWDSKISIPLLESIANGTKPDYSESDRVKAQISLARMGVEKWETYLLDSIFNNFDIDFGIEMCSYICTQKSAYKYVDILKDRSDGMDYGLGWHSKKVLQYRTDWKGNVVHRDSVLISTYDIAFPNRYKLMRYLLFSNGSKMFKNANFTEGFEEYIKFADGQFTRLSQDVIERMVYQTIIWLEANKGNYVLDRYCAIE